MKMDTGGPQFRMMGEGGGEKKKGRKEQFVAFLFSNDAPENTPKLDWSHWIKEKKKKEKGSGGGKALQSIWEMVPKCKVLEPAVSCN